MKLKNFDEAEKIVRRIRHLQAITDDLRDSPILTVKDKFENRIVTIGGTNSEHPHADIAKEFFENLHSRYIKEIGDLNAKLLEL